MLYNLKEATLKIDTTSINYAVFGNGTKPLVIIPGLTLRDVKGAGWSLAYMYRIFAKDYRVYVFDKKEIIPEGYKIKNLADEYFSSELPVQTLHPSIKDEIPEYEKLYEPVSQGMSFESASEIEALSWETTGKLVEAFSEEDDITENTIVEEPQIEIAQGTEDDFFTSLGDVEIEFIKAALSENYAEQGRIAASAGSLADVIADKINTLSADTRGDILLEDIGAGYAVLEDYIDETKGALNYDG